MKVAFILLSFSCASAFTGVVSPRAVSSSSSLSMGLLDSMFKTPSTPKKTKKKKSSDNWLANMFAEPLHGHGSGENDLEEMYQAQQALLRLRRQVTSKDVLRKKYQVTGEDHLRDIKLIAHNPADLNKKEDDAMYVDQERSLFPWENKKLKP